MLSSRPKHILLLLAISNKGEMCQFTGLVVKESEIDGKVRGTFVADSHTESNQEETQSKPAYRTQNSLEILHLSYPRGHLHPV